MADFNLASSTPTQQDATLASNSFVEGVNNTGFGISPTYVYASEFAVGYALVTTTPTQQAQEMNTLAYLFARPLDNRIVPMRTPLPREVATRTVVVTTLP